MSAAFDRRRIASPESSYAPTFASDQSPGAGPSARSQRRNDEVRPIFLKTGLISQANGSGYIEAGGVKIACSVYGPRPKQPPYTPQGSLNLEIKFAPFASHPRRAPLRDTEPSSLSSLLTSHLIPSLQLHLLPKSALDVHLLILESDTVTNVLSAGLTVASAAIADAGVPMNALSIGTAVIKSKSELLVDPDQHEADGQGLVVAGVMPALGKVGGIWMSGEMDVEEAYEAIEAAVVSSKATHTVLAQALLERAEVGSDAV